MSSFTILSQNKKPVISDFKIAEIESVGYLIKEKEEIEVIVPSKVTIYRYNSTQRE